MKACSVQDAVIAAFRQQWCEMCMCAVVEAFCAGAGVLQQRRSFPTHPVVSPKHKDARLLQVRA